jgi:stringent starvation protein B
MEYVKNNEIVLNVGFEATSGLKLGNEFIEFRARFGGVSRDIAVPVDRVVAIYARENGQGMAFPLPTGSVSTDAAEGGSGASPARGLRLASTEPEPETDQPDQPDPHPPGPQRPSLKRIK